MKRRLMLAAMSLILTVTLSVTSMNTVAEASPKMSPTEENLEITINSFLESDGAVAEELTDEMLKTFLETPLDFLRVIDTYPLDKQELLLSRIANVAVFRLGEIRTITSSGDSFLTSGITQPPFR